MDQNLLIPRSFYLTNKQELLEHLKSNYFDSISLVLLSIYFSFGAGAAIAHDQAISLSNAHRDAGFMIFHPAMSVMHEFVARAYSITSEYTKIPEYIGGNHFPPYNYGPLHVPNVVCWNGFIHHLINLKKYFIACM